MGTSISEPHWVFPEAGTLAGEAAENQGVGWRGTKVHVSEGLLGGGGGKAIGEPIQKFESSP